jgi:hypothetical protein
LFLILFCHQDSKSPSFTKLLFLKNGVNFFVPYFRTHPDAGAGGEFVVFFIFFIIINSL